MSLMTGHAYEAEAEKYLLQQGLTCLDRNYKCKMGEIDLICLSGCNTIVFVEVKYRQNASHGNALSAVTLAKQRKIIKAATYYLQQKDWTDQYTCRFDVIAIDNTPQSSLQWVKDAFRPGWY